MSHDLKLAWDRARQRSEERGFKYGTVGKHNPDTTITYTVTGRTDRLWVTLTDKTVVEARNEAGVPQEEDYPVRMVVRNRVHVIVGRDTRGTQAVPTPTPPSGVLPHPMEDHTDIEFTSETAGNVLKYNGSDWINSSSIPEAIAATIEAAAAKTTPVDADDFGITDSAASNVLKKLSWANLKLGITAMISAFAAKTTPIDADSVVITDSAASDAPKRTTLTNFKLFFKTYFDTLYDLTATAITALATKTTPVGADALVITDSAAAGAPKRLTFTNLITYLSTLFMDLTTAQTVATGIKTFTPGIVTPSVDGSIAANGDLTVQGTTHSTRTTSYFIVQPNGGGMLIGGPAHLASLATIVEIVGDVGVNSPFMLFDTRSMVAGVGGNVAGGGYTDGTTTPARFAIVAMQKENGVSGDFTGVLNILVNDGSSANGFLSRLKILGSNGYIGNMATPLGQLHLHDGVGGWLNVTKTGVAGSQVEIIPNVAGDVTQMIRWSCVAVSSGGVRQGGDNNATPGGSVNLFSDGGTNVLTLTVEANGRVYVQRTAGSLTYTINLRAHWI